MTMTNRDFLEKFAAEAIRLFGSVDQERTRSFEVVPLVDPWHQVRLTRQHFGYSYEIFALEFCERKLDHFSWHYIDDSDSLIFTSADADVTLEILDLYREMIKAETVSKS